MPLVEVHEAELVIRLSLVESLVAVHRGPVVVALADVDRVAVVDEAWSWLRGRRRGLHVPGVVAMGTWRHDHGRDFVDLRAGAPGAVVIDTVSDWSRLLLAVDDPPGLRRLLVR